MNLTDYTMNPRNRSSKRDLQLTETFQQYSTAITTVIKSVVYQTTRMTMKVLTTTVLTINRIEWMLLLSIQKVAVSCSGIKITT